MKYKYTKDNNIHKNNNTNNIVIRFCGDSGDGMQLTGTLFSNISASMGNEVSTFPDYPSEIRAPQGTTSGVSGFQVHIGTSIHTPGNEVDVLVAMNPAALKTNHHTLKDLGVLIFDTSTFGERGLQKAGYITYNPFEELGLSDSLQLIPVNITKLTQDSLSEFGLDNKSILKSKNMFVLGIICWLFNKPLDQAIHFISKKFDRKPEVLKYNIKVLTDGFNYGSNIHLDISTFVVGQSDVLTKGNYTIISGNKASAWGLIAASQKSNKQLFLGSYPITPATDILHELSLRKDMGVVSVQAEDEIAGICMALGASFAGDLAVTTTSGPGLALKGEAIGLGVMSELPIVIIDVQRGGPSTGLPTKTEQTDLLQALYGRNGESPLVVMAASSPDNCFHYSYMAAKIALENMTPVILLTDAFIGNGSSLWKLPRLSDLPSIVPHIATDSLKDNYKMTTRNEETKVRYWAYPGMDGFVHRNGGLEKDYKNANISMDGKNHAKMVKTRAEKISNISKHLPLMKVEGNSFSDILIIGWGSTYGHLLLAAKESGVALLQFNYINPLPSNAEHIIRKYKQVIVCELNSGHLATYLRTNIQGVNFLQYNKIEGQPFNVNELVEYIDTINYE